MSLDVYLIENYKDNDIETYNKNELVHLYGNYEIYKLHDGRDSFLDYISRLPSGWRKIANSKNPNWEEENETVYDANITHNLNVLAEKAGIYEALWRPYQLHPDFKHGEDYYKELEFENSVEMQAKDIIPVLEKGLKKLKKNSAYYKKFEAKNGWGLYIHFVPFVEKYLEACKQYPESIIKVSR